MWCSLAHAHLKLKANRDAITCARRAVSLAPDLEWPHRIISIAHWQAGRGQDAVTAAREAVRLAPSLALAHGQLARALSIEGIHRLRESKREAEEALRLAPNDAAIHTMAGSAALHTHRYRLAEKHFLGALAIDPDNSHALNDLAIARLRQLRLLSAAQGFKSVGAMAPSSDLGRRNTDATIGRFFLTLIWLIVGISLLTLLNRWAATIALGIPVLIAYVAVQARRLLNRRTWGYVWKRPFDNGRLLLQLGLVAAGTTALIASLREPEPNVHTIATTVAVWLGLFGAIQTLRILSAGPQRY